MNSGMSMAAAVAAVVEEQKMPNIIIKEEDLKEEDLKDEEVINVELNKKI